MPIRISLNTWAVRVHAVTSQCISSQRLRRCKESRQPLPTWPQICHTPPFYFAARGEASVSWWIQQMLHEKKVEVACRYRWCSIRSRNVSMTSCVKTSGPRDNTIAIYVTHIHLAKAQNLRPTLASLNHYDHVRLARDDALCLECCVLVPPTTVQVNMFLHFQAVTQEHFNQLCRWALACINENCTYHIAVQAP